MHYTRAIQKATSSELLKKAMRKKVIIYNYFPTQSLPELRYLSNQGISFCMPVSKKHATCELSHILTLSINSSLLLRRCDPNYFFM
jgi:hypothetical protein